MYMGLSLLFLAVVYVFNRNIQLRARVKRLVEIALLVACLNLTGALYVLHGFTYPHLYSYRYAFILVILLIVSAVFIATTTALLFSSIYMLSTSSVSEYLSASFLKSS